MSWQYAFFFKSARISSILFSAPPDLLRLELIRFVRMVKLVPSGYRFTVLLVQGGLVLCDTSLGPCSNGYFKLSADILCRTEYMLSWKESLF